MIILQHDIDRFLSKIDKKGPNDCWLWTASINTSGYGHVRIDHTTKLAHILAWELVNGSVTEGKLILHKCDNKKCCNPKHLYEGTHSDNMRDRCERYKGNVGGGSRKNMFSISELNAIKLLVEKGFTQRSIANTFGVSQSYISFLSKGIRGSNIFEGVNI